MKADWRDRAISAGFGWDAGMTDPRGAGSRALPLALRACVGSITDIGKLWHGFRIMPDPHQYI